MSTEADKVNTGALATIVAVGTFAMIGIAAAVTALVRYDVEAASEAKRENADRPLREVRGQQTGKLNAPPAWIDRGKGTIALPIDHAMRAVVTDLQRDPNTATAIPPTKDAGVDAAEQQAASDGGDAGDAAVGEADGGTGATPESAKPLEHAPDQDRKGPGSLTGELKEGKEPVPVSGGGVPPNKAPESKPATPSEQVPPTKPAPKPNPPANGQ